MNIPILPNLDVCSIVADAAKRKRKIEGGMLMLKCAKVTTDLEDIGDWESVLGRFAAGGDDGNGRPRHGDIEELLSLVSWGLDLELLGCQFSPWCGR